MKIEFIPKDYTPIEQGLLFGFTTESEEPSNVEVQIVDADTEQVVATQRLMQVVSGVVNIAPYVERFEEREPALPSEALSAITEAERAHYKIRIGEVESGVVTISPIRREVVLPDLVTKMPLHRTLTHGDCDELLFVVAPETDIEVDIESDLGESLSLLKSNAEGAMRLVLATAEFDKKATRLSLSVKLNGAVWHQVEYDLVPSRKQALRMVWETSCGAFERYTFPVAYLLRSEVEKQRVGNGRNLDTVSVLHSKSVKVVSNYEPRSVVAALSDIIASPKVWYEGKEGLVRVDILTSATDCNLFGEPDCITLELRTTKRRVSL